MGNSSWVEMIVLRINPYLREDRPLMWLGEKGPSVPRLLPIAIGEFEAAAIQMAILDEPPIRPVSYDLISSMLECLDIVIDRVVIDKVCKSIFYARVIMTVHDQKLSLDSRPSDAVALAVRTGAGIFVNDTLLDTVGMGPAHNDEDIEQSMERFHEFEPQLIKKDPSSEPQRDSTPRKVRQHPSCSPESLSENVMERLKRHLQRAIICENYEEAARLRDKIAAKRKGQEG